MKAEIVLSYEEVEEALREYVRERSRTTVGMVEAVLEPTIVFREGPEYWQSTYPRMEAVFMFEPPAVRAKE